MVWNESLLEVFGEKLLRERRDQELLDYARDSVAEDQGQGGEDNPVRLSVYSDSRESASLISQMLRTAEKSN